MLDQAAELANEILDARAVLDSRCADLDKLAQLLTSEGRKLNAQPPRLPPQIGSALASVDRQLIGTANPSISTDWKAQYDALCQPPAQSEE